MEPETAQGWDVFVSCTGEDRDWVRPIVDALSHRFTVFLDERTIEHAESITDSLRRAIGSSRVFLACYSPTFTTRTACQWELTSAFVAIRSSGTLTDRIIVLNPVQAVEHIEPVELRDARFVVAGADPQVVLDAVTARLTRFETPIGPIPNVDPGWWPRRPLGACPFVGRAAELWAVHSRMFARDFSGVEEVTGPPLVQIRGMGGVGKSLLAEVYATRFAAAFPGGIFWLNLAGDPSRTTDSDAVLAEHHHQLKALSELLGADSAETPTLDQLRGQLAAVLDARPGPYLWVLDDIPPGLPTEVIATLMPAGTNGRTLLSTRYRGYRFGASLDVDVLPEADALALLTRGRLLAGEDVGQAAELARDLGYHTLALDLAASCLSGLDGIVTFADLRQALAQTSDDGFQDLVDELSGEVPASSQRNIAATLWRSITLLGEQGLDLLLVAACLAPAPIPGPTLVAVLATTDELTDEIARRKVAAGLRQVDMHSLARLDTTDGQPVACLTHPMVSRAVRLAGSRRLRREALKGAAVTVLRKQLSNVTDAASRASNEAVLPHARVLATSVGVGREELDLLDAVARTDYEIGAWNSALTLYQREHRMLLDELGDRHQFTLQAAGNVASLLSALGRHAEAETIEREVLVGRTETLGESDPVSLVAANNLTLTLRELGRPGEAAVLLRRIADATRTGMGADHVQTLTSEANLASVLSDLAQHQEALDIQQRVSPLIAAALGPDHPLTLWVVNTMTTSLQGLGRINEAIQLGAEVHRRRKMVLGPEHPATLMTAHNVASLLNKAGDHDQARELQEQILEIRTRVLGRAHPETLATANNLASTLANLGFVKRAADMRRDTWEQLAATLGEDHLSTLAALSNLSFSLRALRLEEEAAEAEERAWRGRRRQLGDTHPHTIASAGHLHLLALQLGHDELRAELEAASPQIDSN